MTVRKPFDKALFDLADTKAKKHMVGWLKEQGYTNIATNETYYFDIICTVDDLPRLLYEVEIKYSWKGDWPDSWREIRIPERKRRLLDKWKEESPDDVLTFVVFRDDCKKAWHIDGATLLECEVKEAPNRNIRKGEKFFHIPTSDAYLVDMTHVESSY